jgi:hypothetical protein
MTHHFEHSLAQRLAPIATALVLAIIWLKVGRVPTASSGDDVWSTDTAYAFITQGTFKTPMLNDVTGRAEHDLSSPPWILTQATSLKLFGLNAYGMCAPAALCTSLVMLGAWLLVRQLGGSQTMAYIATVAIMGSFVIERGLSQGRPEPWNVIALVFGLWSMMRGTRAMLLISGVCLSVGGMAYLGQSPFFTAAWFAAFAILHGKDLRAWGLAMLGAAPGSIAFFTWLANHWGEFQRQTLNVGQSQYLGWSNLLAPITELVHGIGSQEWLARAELLTACVVAGSLAWHAKANRSLQALGVAALIASGPMFLFTAARQATPSVLICAALCAAGQWQRRLCGLLLVGLISLGLLRLGLNATTVIVQRHGRDYAEVTRQLRAALPHAGPVAVGKRAFLALREVTAPTDLDYLPYTWPSIPYTPLRAKRADAASLYSHVVIERDLIETYQTIYPWFKEAVASGRMRITHQVTLPIEPLPWDKKPVYDLVIFTRS